jgi:N-acylneuraminate cytidylyltransferase
MSSIAIIPARGGSKRIPRKNIKPFLGKPIIAYSIEAALESKLFDEVMVSTDDAEIAKIAKQYGASVPFMRSAKTADDFATTADAIIEVIDTYRKLGREFDHVACIYPTAPFTTAAKLTTAFEKLSGNAYSSVFPVVKFGYPILRSLKIEDGRVSMNWPEHLNARSQDLPKAYHDSGQFYIASTATFLAERTFFTSNSAAIIVDEMEVQDIDNETDWKIAEVKYQMVY